MNQMAVALERAIETGPVPLRKPRVRRGAVKMYATTPASSIRTKWETSPYYSGTSAVTAGYTWSPYGGTTTYGVSTNDLDFTNAYQDVPAIDWTVYASAPEQLDNNLRYQLLNDGTGRYEYTVTTATTMAYSTYNLGTGGYSLSGLAEGTTFTVSSDGLTIRSVPLTEEEREEQRKQAFRASIRDAIRSRLSPEEKRQRKYLAALKSPEEQKARDTLRDMLSEQEWRRYVTNSFVMVKGASGKHYQVFADGRRTAVFEKGKQSATLCIHTDHECPPTDHVLNLKLLIELDEPAIWRGSNAAWNKGFGPPSEPIAPMGVYAANAYNLQIADLNTYGENLIVNGHLGAAMDRHIATTLVVTNQNITISNNGVVYARPDLPTWTGPRQQDAQILRNPDGTLVDFTGYNPETCVERFTVQEGPEVTDNVAAMVLGGILTDNLKTHEKGKSIKERSLVELFKRTGT